MIEAISKGCIGTLSDGTLRYEIRFDPKYRAEAAELYGEPGSPVVLVRLTPEAAKEAAQAEIIATDKQKGGPLAKLAGMWCREPEFYEFIRPIYYRMLGGNGNGTGDVYVAEDGDIRTEELFCKHAILVFCDINSRTALDHDGMAARLFNEKIRVPYMEYLRQSASL